MRHIIYGRNPVKAALDSPRRKPIRLLVQKDIQGKTVRSILEAATQKRLPIEVAEKEVLQKMVGPHALHQGMLLFYEPLGGPTWQDILLKAKANPDAIVVFVDSVEDPRNLGALLRTASALGVEGVILSKAHTVPVNSEVIKASVGEAERINIAQENNFTGIIKEFRENNFWLVAFEAEAERPLWDVDFRGGAWGIVVGGEDRGVRKIVRLLCDFQVCIPMTNAVNSLNVSVAFGIGLYEIIRQKRSKR